MGNGEIIYGAHDYVGMDLQGKTIGILGLAELEAHLPKEQGI